MALNASASWAPMFSARRSASSTKVPLVILATSSPELARNRANYKRFPNRRRQGRAAGPRYQRRIEQGWCRRSRDGRLGSTSNHGNTSDNQSRSRYESTAQLSRKRPRWNRPFYRYGGHIELIRFKEYYRMPRGHEHISFVFSSAFRDIFSQSFLRIRF